MKLLKQAEYMAATGFTFHPTIAFRSGMGPYKGHGSALLRRSRRRRVNIQPALTPENPTHQDSVIARRARASRVRFYAARDAREITRLGSLPDARIGLPDKAGEGRYYRPSRNRLAADHPGFFLWFVTVLGALVAGGGAILLGYGLFDTARKRRTS
jgi:hypothetical protein